MSRRGRSGPTISLFSFQDIITSVTAIVTVVALLLALDLVRQKQSQANDSSGRLAEELAARIAAVDSELAALRAVSATTDDLVREVAATSPAELQREIAQRTARIAELQRELERLARQQETWQAREKDELAEQFDLEPARRQLTAARQETAEFQQQLAADRADNRPLFSLPRGFQKEGWLAVVESGRVSVAPLGRPAAPVVFTASGLPLVGPNAADAFSAWIERQELKSSYFLLLVRPDAAKTFAEVQESLAAKSVAHGFDLVGAEQVLLHPQRGAAP